MRKPLVILVILCLLSACDAPQSLSQATLNQAVRDTMAAQGDDGQTPRSVAHFVYPDPSTESRSKAAVTQFLTGKGYSVDPANGDGLRFEHVTSVAGSSFDQLTESLRIAMLQSGWNYDGWETELIGR